jgi:carbonic anhydrase/acetyltransferase-like protein (isoleucine patch superfamily)
MITHYKNMNPDTDKALFIAPSADIIGSVSLGSDTSIWFNATIRGDMAPITIGDESNIQDNTVIHVNAGMPTHIGKQVTVGHAAIIHACTIGDGALIGMGAIILDEAIIGKECLVAAGALVPPRKVYPPRSLIMGSPAKAVRTLTDEEVKDMYSNTKHYVEKGKQYRSQSM